MIFKFLRLIGAFLLISISTTYAQELRVDTVYFDGSGALVDQSADYLTYEVRSLDKKNRINGVVGKFTQADRLLEATEYTKGEKTGAYERFHRNGKVMVYGKYKNGERVGFWATLDQESTIQSIEEYNEKGTLTSTRDTPFKLGILLDSNGNLIHATFPGGMDAWNQQLRSNLLYPTVAKRYGHEGDVFISFVVLSDGRIVTPRPTISPHYSLSEESIRVLLLTPKWIPAKINGKPVDIEMQVRIVFRLK